MIDKSNYRFNKVVSTETRFMHLIEVLEDAGMNFLRARRKGETFRLDGKVQKQQLKLYIIQ